MTINEKLMNQTLDLDFGLGSIDCNRETLTDINTALWRLKEDMSERDKSRESVYFYEDHRRVRMLADLLYYTMLEFNDNFKKTYAIHTEMLDIIRDLNGKKAPAATGADSVHA